MNKSFINVVSLLFAVVVRSVTMSLFPAYDSNSRVPEPTEHGSSGGSLERATQSHADWLKNPSFAELCNKPVISGKKPVISDSKPDISGNTPAISDSQPDISGNKPEISETKPVFSISDDSDSEIQILRTKSSKKEKKRKKEKRRKRSPEPPNQLKPVQKPGPVQKWSFIDPKLLSASNLILDRRREVENFHYEGTYQKQVAKFSYQLKRCLGGNRNVDVLVFGAPEQKKPVRYFSRKGRKNTARAEKFSPALKTKLDNFLREDFVELSNEWDTGEEKLVYDPSIQMYRPAESVPSASEAADQHDGDVADRAKTLNHRLTERPHDTNLWLQFVRLQDELLEEKHRLISSQKMKSSGALHGGSLREKVTDRGLLERKMAILDRAVGKNPGCVELKLERLRVGRDGLWEREKQRDEWRKLEFAHVNSLQMWTLYLDFCLEHFSGFTVTNMLKVFDRCLEKLAVVLSGKLATHPPQPRTDEFILEIFFRRCSVLIAAGYSEKAVACFQAAVEFNFMPPVEIVNLTIEQRRTFFEPFWDSGCPRVGQKGAQGWKAAMKADPAVKNTNAAESVAENAKDPEDAILADAVGKKDGVVWLALERFRESSHWLPTALSEDTEDPDRTVMYEDIHSSLIEFSSEFLRFRLMHAFLESIGVKPIPFQSTNHLQWSMSAVRDYFTTLPELHCTVFANSLDFRRSLLGFSATNFDEPFRTYFVCCRIDNEVEVCARDGAVSAKDKLKAFKRAAKCVLSEQANRNSLPVYASFVRGLKSLGSGPDEALATARTTLKMASQRSVWDGGEAEFSCGDRCAVLEIVCLVVEMEISKSDCWQSSVTGLLTELFLEGRVKSEQSEQVNLTSVVKAKKNMHDVVLSALKKSYANSPDHLNSSWDADWLTRAWLGSPVTHAVHLAGWFLYACSGSNVEEALKFLEDNLQWIQQQKQVAADVTSGSNRASNQYRWIDCDHERINRSLINLLNYHTKHKRCAPLTPLRLHLKRAVSHFPANPHFLKLFVDAHLRGQLVVDLRRSLDALLSAHSAVNRTDSMAVTNSASCRTLTWLALLYAEFSRYLQLLELKSTGVVGAMPELHRLRHVLERAVERCRSAPEFWRLSMNFERLRGDLDAVKSLFYGAVRQCPWSKDLYMDMTECVPSEAENMTDLMMEKELRLRVPLEEMRLLREAASAGGEAD